MLIKSLLIYSLFALACESTPKLPAKDILQTTETSPPVEFKDTVAKVTTIENSEETLAKPENPIPRESMIPNTRPEPLKEAVDSEKKESEVSEKKPDLSSEHNEDTPPSPEAEEVTGSDEVLIAEAVVNKPDHAAFDKLLKKHVSSSGAVNYAGLKSDKALLGSYLEDLSTNGIKNNWSSSEKLAYWINAYNAFTLKLIIDNYPIKSITDLHGGKPWDVKWIALGDKKYSLNQIENEIIRPQFKEPRIHFAVNCAAKSCPPLLNAAYTASNLESLLESQTRKFINDSDYNKISEGSISVSKIFDWYKVDFGDLISYLNKYSKTKIGNDAKVSFEEYNWALNN